MRLVQEADGFDILIASPRRGAGAMTLRAQSSCSRRRRWPVRCCSSPSCRRSRTPPWGATRASILQDNYRSVLAAERMKEALERIDSAAMFIVAGERPRGVTQADAELRALRARAGGPEEQHHRARRARGDQRCSCAPGWPTGQRSIAFVGEVDHATLEAQYFATMNPLFVATKDAADRILDLNQDAMVRKRRPGPSRGQAVERGDDRDRPAGFADRSRRLDRPHPPHPAPALGAGRDGPAPRRG